MSNLMCATRFWNNLHQVQNIGSHVIKISWVAREPNGLMRKGLLYAMLKKSLKIPKRKSESVNWRTDNKMTKRKRTNGQTTIFKTLHRKLKIEQH